MAAAAPKGLRGELGERGEDDEAAIFSLVVLVLNFDGERRILVLLKS